MNKSGLPAKMNLYNDHTMTATNSNADSSDCSSPTAYYVLFMPSDVDETSLDLNSSNSSSVSSTVPNAEKSIFTDKQEVLAVMKTSGGARFKAFKTYEEALEFSRHCCSEPRNPTNESPDLERGTTVSAPTRQELEQLRKAIESGNAEFVRHTVRANPRYLVSSGDTPTILQKRPRYNALHIAAKSNQAAIGEIILNTIEDPTFMKLLYDDDSPSTTLRRMTLLVDLYLNMPNKVLHETPLHFASKFGCVRIVKMLASRPACKKHLQNKDGKTAKDVICARCSSNEMRSQIEAALEERGTTFSAPTRQELEQLRKAIESGNAEFVRHTVRANPRYLVSSGDTPTILQTGPRYNALHIAAKSSQPVIGEIILNTIEDPTFMKLLYDDDSPSTTLRRMTLLVDLYLNMPNKVLHETPLHFASKFGCVRIVKMLASRPACKKHLQNKDGKTAKDVICARCSSNEMRSQIEDALEDDHRYYVPVLTVEDDSHQPYVGDPWSPRKLPPSDLPSNSRSPFAMSPFVRAYAGPMSLKQAREFHQKWKTQLHLKCSTRSGYKRVRLMGIHLSDTDKGLERIGRELARDLDIPWLEHWSFLGTFCNLSKADGLTQLETYLRNKHNEMSSNARYEASPSVSILDDDSSVFEDETTSSRNVGSPGTLCSKSDDAFSDDSDARRPDECLAVFISGAEPTKLDLDVLRALEGVYLDPVLYPNTCLWQYIVNSFAREEAESWPTPKSSFGRTPLVERSSAP